MISLANKYLIVIYIANHQLFDHIEASGLPSLKVYIHKY
jgi:hypothetical protein